MTTKPSILLATTHWKNNSHHSNYSGFQRLAYYLTPYFDVSLVTWGDEKKLVKENEIKVIILEIKGKTFFKKRNRIASYCKEYGKDYDYVFLLYADLGVRLGSDINYVAAVHNLVTIGKYQSFKEQVILRLKHSLIEPRVYKKASHIICVASNIQKALHSKYTDKTHFIPHGIDIHFWQSGIQKQPFLLDKPKEFQKTAVCVGINGVNMEYVQKCIIFFSDVLFFLVGAFDFDYPNVRILKGISDEELKSLYQQTDVFFRPLDFATANNSLLEAMAMEKKIVITKTGGVTDYINADYAYLAKRDNSDFVKQMERCLSNTAIPPRLEDLREYTCQNFAWEVIARKIYQLLS